jgi:UV DNA damage endonuclease
MEHRLGYVANAFGIGLGASHTCRLAAACGSRLEELIAQNLAELETILLYNESRGIEMFRIGSSLVPFASHPQNRLRWWKTFARDFDVIGRIARRSRQRLSLHPSPAGATLASARPAVRVATVRELRYATRVLDLLGQGPDARVIVHVGGAAPDRLTAFDNARRFLDRMPSDAKRRLAVEHDDRVWTAREVLPLAWGHGLPMVADSLHNAVLPSSPVLPLRKLLLLANRTWEALALRPKAHLASQKPGGPRGAHSDYIDPDDYLAILAALPAPTDLMLEAKSKDLALFALRGVDLQRPPVIESRFPQAV